MNINAYHQPGVEAGTKAASGIVELELQVLRYLSGHSNSTLSLSEICHGIGREEDVEMVFKICERLAANPDRRISKVTGNFVFDSGYRKI